MTAKEAHILAIQAHAAQAEDNYNDIKERIIARSKQGEFDVTFDQGGKLSVKVLLTTTDRLLAEGYMVSSKPSNTNRLGKYLPSRITVDWSAE